jgi:hypothetical protein
VRVLKPPTGMLRVFLLHRRRFLLMHCGLATVPMSGSPALTPLTAVTESDQTYDLCVRRTSVITFTLGLIVAVLGLIWSLQGFGVLGGSPMSNTTTWSIAGPITALIGIGIAVASWRRSSSK